MSRSATRTAIDARTATVDDVPVLVSLYAELGSTALPRVRRGRLQTPQFDAATIEAGFLTIFSNPDSVVFLATLGAEPVGFALVTIASANPLMPEPILRIGPLVVAPQARRRGAGRALVAAAVSWGDERGMHSASIGLRPADRDGNRYFARLGFAALEVRRVAPLPLLRRQLGQSQTPDLLRRRHVGSAPALRRRLRTRETAAVVSVARDPKS